MAHERDFTASVNQKVDISVTGHTSDDNGVAASTQLSNLRGPIRGVLPAPYKFKGFVERQNLAMCPVTPQR